MYYDLQLILVLRKCRYFTDQIRWCVDGGEEMILIPLPILGKDHFGSVKIYLVHLNTCYQRMSCAPICGIRKLNFFNVAENPISHILENKFSIFTKR